eukprot:281108-Pelagomonas_calceolata.AAC.5
MTLIYAARSQGAMQWCRRKAQGSWPLLKLKKETVLDETPAQQCKAQGTPKPPINIHAYYWLWHTKYIVQALIPGTH